MLGAEAGMAKLVSPEPVIRLLESKAALKSIVIGCVLFPTSYAWRMESADKAAAVINVSSMLPFTGTALSAHVDGPALPPIQKESVELNFSQLPFRFFV